MAPSLIQLFLQSVPHLLTPDPLIPDPRPVSLAFPFLAQQLMGWVKPTLLSLSFQDDNKAGMEEDHTYEVRSRRTPSSEGHGVVSCTIRWCGWGMAKA